MRVAVALTVVLLLGGNVSLAQEVSKAQRVTCGSAAVALMSSDVSRSIDKVEARILSADETQKKLYPLIKSDALNVDEIVRRMTLFDDFHDQQYKAAIAQGDPDKAHLIFLVALGKRMSSGVEINLSARLFGESVKYRAICVWDDAGSVVSSTPYVVE